MFVYQNNNDFGIMVILKGISNLAMELFALVEGFQILHYI